MVVEDDKKNLRTVPFYICPSSVCFVCRTISKRRRTFSLFLAINGAVIFFCVEGLFFILDSWEISIDTPHVEDDDI